MLNLHSYQAKTGIERLVIFENGASCFHYVQRYRELAKWNEPTDLIFAAEKNRQRPRDLSYMFRKLTGDWGLRFDTAGRARSLYSIRHFAIEQMLLRSVPPIAIAKLAGTSLKMMHSFYDETSILQYKDRLNKNRTLYPFLVKPDEPTNNEQIASNGGKLLALKPNNKAKSGPA